MKIVPTILIILLSSFFSHNLTAQVTLPSEDYIQGWKKADNPLHFQKENLFDYINGGAEIFHEFGFKDLSVQSYKNGEEEIVLELYQMESLESALAIYLTRKGKENPIEGISVRNTGNRYQFTILHGNYLIQVSNFSGNEKLIPVMTKLVQPVLAEIPPKKYSKIFKDLPKENLVKGSERLIRGIYSIQPIYTFGYGDILQLDGEIFGLVGDYKFKKDSFTLLLISYPSEEKSRSVLTSLINNLDPYLKILSKWQDGFIFEDYQNKYGIVERDKENLSFKIKLTKKPGKS